jgi:superfamily II DNA or RNA helicase
MGMSRKWIIFTKSIAFAKSLQEYLGGNTAIYHSKLKPIERELNLIAFEQNQFNILIAVDALNEGLNVSQVEAAICAAGVSTELTNSQQLGQQFGPYQVNSVKPKSKDMVIPSQAGRNSGRV